jgi:hypothetical protein
LRDERRPTGAASIDRPCVQRCVCLFLGINLFPFFQGGWVDDGGGGWGKGGGSGLGLGLGLGFEATSTHPAKRC